MIEGLEVEGHNAVISMVPSFETTSYFSYYLGFLSKTQ